jgi:hypothetical protein
MQESGILHLRMLPLTSTEYVKLKDYTDRTADNHLCTRAHQRNGVNLDRLLGKYHVLLTI